MTIAKGQTILPEDVLAVDNKATTAATVAALAKKAADDAATAAAAASGTASTANTNASTALTTANSAAGVAASANTAAGQATKAATDATVAANAASTAISTRPSMVLSADSTTISVTFSGGTVAVIPVTSLTNPGVTTISASLSLTNNTVAAASAVGTVVGTVQVATVGTPVNGALTLVDNGAGYFKLVGTSLQVNTATTVAGTYVVTLRYTANNLPTAQQQNFNISVQAVSGNATVLPVGVSGNFNTLLNATFGTSRTGATVTTHAQLMQAPGAIMYPFYEYGVNPGQAHQMTPHTGRFGSETSYGPQGAGTDGLYGQYRARHTTYPESSPHNLHVLKSDRITLRAFAGVDGNVTNVQAGNIDSGMMRFLVALRPGDFMEIRCKMPKGKYAWPAFWTNPGEQAGWNNDGTPGNLISSDWPPENDIFDQFGFDNVDPGHYLFVATPDNGHPERYNVGDVNMPGTNSPFVATSVATWEAGYYANTPFDQTADFHVYGCYMGLDDNAYYYVDGVLYRIRGYHHPDTKPPAQLICSLQPGPVFNNLSAMTDQGGVTNGWDWDIDYVRAWRTVQTPPATVDGNPNGVTFNTLNNFVATGGVLANGAIGQGWSDPNNLWSQRSDNMLTGGVVGGGPWWSTNQLVRSSSTEAKLNTRTQQRFIQFTQSQLWATARVTGSGNSQTMIIGSPGKVACIVNGTRVDDQGTAYYCPTYTWLDLQMDVIQVTATETRVTVTTYAATGQNTPALCTGAVLHTRSFKVTTSAVQNVAGVNGLFFSYLYQNDNQVSPGVYNSLFSDGQVLAQWKSFWDGAAVSTGGGGGGGSSGTFTSVLSYAGSGGPITQGQIGQGWTDAGGMWSLRSDNLMSSATIGNNNGQYTAALTRKASGEQMVNSRTQARFVCFSDNTTFWIEARLRTPSGDLQPFSICAQAGQVAVLNNGGFTGIQGTPLSLSQGQWYDIRMDVVSSSTSSTTVVVTVWTASSQTTPATLGTGTQVASNTFTITDTVVQSPAGAGGNGMFWLAPATSSQGQIVAKFETYLG